jgi:DNA polymerase elongation subunit (family B)
MMKVVFDIETSGAPFETLDEQQQRYLLKFAETDEQRANEKLKVNLYPFTAEVVCIGMLNVDTRKGRVLLRGGELAPWQSDDGAIDYLPFDERGLLEQFWRDIAHYDQLVSFNGRAFDGPFLHIRSAMLGVHPSRPLVTNRYNPALHCDLLEQLTYYGVGRKFSLDFVCTAFGIDSPKRHGIDGHDINELFRAGRLREIAEYNARDLHATRELFLRWEEFLRLP